MCLHAISQCWGSIYFSLQNIHINGYQESRIDLALTAKLPQNVGSRLILWPKRGLDLGSQRISRQEARLDLLSHRIIDSVICSSSACPRSSVGRVLDYRANRHVAARLERLRRSLFAPDGWSAVGGSGRAQGQNGVS